MRLGDGISAKLQVVGRLADRPAKAGGAVRGLLVRSGAGDVVLAPADLPSFTKLHPGRVVQRQALHTRRPFQEVCTYCPAASVLQ